MAARPPSLRAIVAFESAARHGTFREAAQELNLTDSAIGHAVRGLEERLGQRLFTRDRGGLRLTARGRALLARVSVGLSLLGEAFDIQPWRPRTRLSVTVMPAFAERFLCARVGGYLDAYPEVHLEITSTPEVVDLAQSDMDVGIRYGMGRWGGVHAQLLAPVTLVPVASPTYRRGDLPQNTKALLGSDLIDERHTPWRLALGREREAPFRLRVDDISEALRAAEAGVGVALAPALLAADSIAEGRLTRVTSLQLRSDLGFWLVWRNSSDKQSMIDGFAGWLAAETAAMEGPFSLVA